jgi:hypothetical protein
VRITGALIYAKLALACSIFHRETGSLVRQSGMNLILLIVIIILLLAALPNWPYSGIGLLFGVPQISLRDGALRGRRNRCRLPANA